MPTTQKKVNITLERDNGVVKLLIKIPKEVEDYFSNLSGGVQKISKVWLKEDGSGCKFYQVTPAYEVIEKRLSTEGRVFNDFGELLIGSNEAVNLAPLRTVGASEGVTLVCGGFASIDNLTFEYYIKQLAIIVKGLLENCIAKKKIVAEITYKVEG